MDIDLSVIIPVFLTESEENLAELEDALLALEGRPGDAELLNTVFRAAHTLKGNAANLGFAPVAEFAHQVEDLLDRLREGTVVLTRPLAGLMLLAVDALRALVPAAVEGLEALTPAHRDLLARIAECAEGGSAAGSEPSAAPPGAPAS